MSVLLAALHGLKEVKAFNSATVALPPRLVSPTATGAAPPPPEHPEMTRAAAAAPVMS
jgi:hypothetical protein